jgi:hypothetical protein
MQWTTRLPWKDLPPHVRAAAEGRLAGAVTRVDPVVGGFSTGFAGIVRTAREELFIKATSARLNEHGRMLYQQERAACQQLAAAGTSVGFVWGLDIGDWTVLAFQPVGATICSPAWPSEQLGVVLRHLRSTRVAAPTGLPALADRLEDAFSAWRALAAEPAFRGWPDGPLRPWEWIELAERASHAFAGDDLLHADLRADNILWTGTGSPVIVDWAYACRGAGAFDPIYLLLEVAREYGEPPEDALAWVLDAYRCDPDDATALLAALAGWFAWLSTLPPPPGLPALQDFRTDMAAAALGWVRARLTSARTALLR